MFSTNKHKLEERISLNHLLEACMHRALSVLFKYFLIVFNKFESEWGRERGSAFRSFIFKMNANFTLFKVIASKELI